MEILHRRLAWIESRSSTCPCPKPSVYRLRFHASHLGEIQPWMRKNIDACREQCLLNNMNGKVQQKYELQDTTCELTYLCIVTRVRYYRVCIWNFILKLCLLYILYFMRNILLFIIYVDCGHTCVCKQFVAFSNWLNVYMSTINVENTLNCCCIFKSYTLDHCSR